MDKRLLFVGGDGLSIIRMNHSLKDHPDMYLDSSPFIIPVQGESPHGVYHVMHAGWRLFIRFIRVCANELNNQQVQDDPPVKEFNRSLYFLWRLTRATSEYLVHISRTPGAVDIDMPQEFIAECEFNIDVAWVAHFLYDFAYLVLDFKQGIRGGKSDDIDLLWREFFALGRTSSANKTQYVPMSIMRIFWARAMHPDLAKLYAAIRSIPMSGREGAMIGWDCVIEWLNGAITAGVTHQVSEERIEKFIQNYPFLQHNYTALREDLLKSREQHLAFMKAMDSDVARLKSFFMDKIGPDWQTATRANSIPRLGITRGKAPWDEVRDVMTQPGDDSVGAVVAKHVRNLTGTYYRWNA